MNTICADPSRPLDPAKAAVLAKVLDLARDEPAQPMLVGAFARDVWFWHVHGIETTRATEDVDLSMEFPDWAGFDRFAAKLIQNGFTQPVANHPEKLKDPATGIAVDLLPFGGLSADGRSIVWPVDNSSWGILGFVESLRVAPVLVFAPSAGNGLRIATLASLVILKLIAMYERLADRRKKDSADIGFILARYLDAGNRDRLLDWRDAGTMDLVEGDLQRAGARLLGADMGRIAAATTREQILQHLEREVGSSSRCPLAQEVSGGVTRGDFQRARRLLRDLKDGMEGVSNAQPPYLH